MNPEHITDALSDYMFRDDPANLSITDPEFVQYFGDFALKEIPEDMPLPAETRLVVTLAAVIAAGSHTTFEAFVNTALDSGVEPSTIKEVVYQAVAYVGFARVSGFLNVTNAAFTARGIPLPLEDQSTTSPGTRLDAGLAVQKQIIGEDLVEKLYASAPADEQHIQRYLSANCFGDTYTRTGLDIQTRELATLAFLVALGGAEPQVAGHVVANQHVGNDRSTMIAAVTHLLPYIGYPRTLNALRAINENTAI